MDGTLPLVSSRGHGFNPEINSMHAGVRLCTLPQDSAKAGTSCARLPIERNS